MFRDVNGYRTKESLEYDAAFQKIVDEKFRQGIQLGFTPEEILFVMMSCTDSALSRYYIKKQRKSENDVTSLNNERRNNND